MEGELLPSDSLTTCKWCAVNRASVTFEKVEVCDKCYQQGLWARQNPQLCQQCKSLFVDKEYTDALYSKKGLSYAIGYLEKSANNGCGLCRMLHLQDPNPDPRRLGSGLVLFAGSSRNEEPNWETGYASHNDVDSLYFSTEAEQYSLILSVSADDDNPAAKYISQRPAALNLGDENTTKLVRSWLAECLEEHKESLLPEKETFMPTRVIDVAAFPGDDVKLFHPHNMSEKYIAISYCWGTTPFITTNSTNFELHKERIDVSELPQTFKDAIATTRNLGFRYLWIDALCIIQDSAEDKAKEINKMGDIYTKATLTVASVSGSSVADGFLKSKPLLQVDLPYRCPDGAMGNVKISPQISPDLWHEPLYTRAWCLQENLLSPRMLLYTNTEVIWQCQSKPMRRPHTTHVSYQHDNPDLPASAFTRLPAAILNPDHDLLKKEDPTVGAERYRIWRSLVENYTRRRLTVASDRLPALAGIAQKFKEAWSDEYYFGIWKSQFIPSLAWRRDSSLSNQGPYPPLTEYRAPSWSWASIYGPVEFDIRYDVGNSKAPSTVLLECVNEMASDGVHEYLKAKVEASMIRVSEFPHTDFNHGQRVYFDDHSHDVTWPRFVDKIEDLSEEMLDMTWLMLLREGPVNGSKKMRSTTALVLMEASDRGSFSRIGLFDTSVKGAWKSWASPKYRRIVTII